MRAKRFTRVIPVFSRMGSSMSPLRTELFDWAGCTEYLGNCHRHIARMGSGVRVEAERSHPELAVFGERISTTRSGGANSQQEDHRPVKTLARCLSQSYGQASHRQEPTTRIIPELESTNAWLMDCTTHGQQVAIRPVLRCTNESSPAKPFDELDEFSYYVQYETGSQNR
jgi:hypothetical protein